MNLFLVTYILALLLWIPLGILMLAAPSTRKRLMVPLVMSMIGAVYEMGMRAVLSAQVIRIDIILAMYLLNAVYAISGFALLISARARADRGVLLIAAALCLAIPALSFVASQSFKAETANLDRNYASGSRLRLDASFRDDETQKRVFGDLKADKNPWAGYYINADAKDDRFAYLIINDEGRFWVYSTFRSTLYFWKGSGAPNAAGDAFEGAGEGHMDLRTRMQLRRQEGGSVQLNVDYGTTPVPATPITASMKKVDPPRFPRPASSPRDEVRFLGVFSGTYGEKSSSFWLTQVWLWESGGEVWGHYIRDNYPRGYPKDFISTEKIAPACTQECKVLSFKSGRGAVTLTRVSADEITAKGEGLDKDVTLKRGETLPGFLFDLAPLATKKENREWLEAVATATGMITWKVPPASGVGQRTDGKAKPP